MALSKPAAEISVNCVFQGHYNEPELNLKVPMALITEHKAIEFEMLYHVASKTFREVKMHQSDTRADLGTAQFTTQAAV